MTPHDINTAVYVTKDSLRSALEHIQEFQASPEADDIYFQYGRALGMLEVLQISLRITLEMLEEAKAPTAYIPWSEWKAML